MEPGVTTCSWWVGVRSLFEEVPDSVFGSGLKHNSSFYPVWRCICSHAVSSTVRTSSRACTTNHQRLTCPDRSEMVFCLIVRLLAGQNFDMACFNEVGVVTFMVPHTRHAPCTRTLSASLLILELPDEVLWTSLDFDVPEPSPTEMSPPSPHTPSPTLLPAPPPLPPFIPPCTLSPPNNSPNIFLVTISRGSSTVLRANTFCAHHIQSLLQICNLCLHSGKWFLQTC